MTKKRRGWSSNLSGNVIPRSVRLSEAPSFGEPIEAYDAMSRGAIAYRHLGKEFRERHGLVEEE